MEASNAAANNAAFAAPALSVILLRPRANGAEQSAIVLSAPAANLVLMMIGLLTIGPIMRRFGSQVEAVITRLLGVILAALAVQFVLDGLQGSIL